MRDTADKMALDFKLWLSDGMTGKEMADQLDDEEANEAIEAVKQEGVRTMREIWGMNQETLSSFLGHCEHRKWKGDS